MVVASQAANSWWVSECVPRIYVWEYKIPIRVENTLRISIPFRCVILHEITHTADDAIHGSFSVPPLPDNPHAPAFVYVGGSALLQLLAHNERVCQSKEKTISFYYILQHFSL